VVFSFIVTTYKLKEGANGTSIKTNHLACTWRVKMKGERSIKGERGTERKGSKSREKYCSN